MIESLLFHKILKLIVSIRIFWIATNWNSNYGLVGKGEELFLERGTNSLLTAQKKKGGDYLNCFSLFTSFCNWRNSISFQVEKLLLIHFNIQSLIFTISSMNNT